MSFYSRLFSKATSRSPDSASRPAAPAKASEATAKPSAADRALAAAAEERALQVAIDGRDVQSVARLVVAGTSTKVRQMAAQAIDDPEVVRQLIRDVRGGNDKGVYKILTSKRDLQLEHARQLVQLDAEVSSASEALERHSQRGYNTLYGPTLDQLGRRWEAVAERADPQLRVKVDECLERCRETVAEHARQVAIQASRELAAATEAAEAQREHEHLVQASAAATAEHARVAEEQARALSEQQRAERQVVRLASDLIRKARGALSDGNTSRAAAVRRTIEDTLAGGGPLPANLVSQIQQLDKQLDELKDWKTFSVAPKRVELIEAMESLIDAPFDPPVLAEKIKNLQDEWRTLGKGAGENSDTDAQRFKAAATKAYQPCKEYFAAQALVRADNLRRRDAVLATLTAFDGETNWEQPDWRAVIVTLREAKQEWRSLTPVDPRAAREQQGQFAALTASLQGRIDSEYARNQEQRESVIERARQLLAGDDARKAIEEVKGLQQKWQALGPVPLAADQRLWREFRRHCDAVFQRREQESAAYTAGLETNKTLAIALCGQVENIAALEGPELLEGKRALVGLKEAFEALGEFPRADARALRNCFDQALKRCEGSFARQQARAAEQGWDCLFDAANLVRAYQLARARGADAAQLDALKSAAESCLTLAQQWPKRGLDTLQQSLNSPCSADLEANETALKLLCVRAEILSDMPTPPEDQALRREYLLQRLAQSMGQGVRADAAQADTLAIEWLRVGPVEEAAVQSLLQRFRRCRDQGQSDAA